MLCYNGDINSVSDADRLEERFPRVDCIMMGRGILADPALGRQLKGGGRADKEELRQFHDMIYSGYCEEMSGDRTILYKMKELWFYLADIFADSKKYAKKIKKAEKCAVYEKIIEEMFRECELTER